MARRWANPTAPSSRPPQLVQADASLDELRGEWRRLYHKDPPRISRDLLILGIAYRLQEIEHGGLGKATLRKLRTLAKTLRATGCVGTTTDRSTHLKTGRAVECGPLPALDLPQEQSLFRFAWLRRVVFGMNYDRADHAVE